MHSSGIDYQKLYKEQDRVFGLIQPNLKAFYLTGETALSRFYLHHRYSDDLDFFLDEGEDFQEKIAEIWQLLGKHYHIDEAVTVRHEDFARIQILGDEKLKIEFVNEKTFHWGQVQQLPHGIFVDNPANILANKLTAILSRDEPKDVFDLITLSKGYHFNWKAVYHYAFKKHIMNEQDVVMRLSTFPVKLLEDQPWLPEKTDPDQFSEHLQTIVDDFLLARDNSLGKGKTPITEAVPQTG